MAEPVIQDGYLALIVALAAFVVCGLFLLTALPLPSIGLMTASAGSLGGMAAGMGRGFAGELAGGPSIGAAYAGPAAESEIRIPPAPSPVQPTDGATGNATPARAASSDAAEKLRLPYEQNGLTFFLDAGRVTAIQAEGHYTRLYQGRESHFCPWSISRVEEHVAGRNFLRTHRSFLVNLEHARAFQRKHDKVYLIVPGPEDNLVPVSRGHVAEVRKALGI
jgi:hypothetical protein